MRVRPPIAWGLAAAVVVAVLVQIPLWEWNIEDAAISFAFARNIAEGWGAVPYPGGVPTEGYSNFAWVMLLVPSFWLGLDPFFTAPALGMLLTALTVPLVFAGARRPLGDEGALASAWAFATFAQVAIWAQSGLENALFNALLAAGIWRLQVDGRRPWAALCFLLLSVTRPEAPGLAALGAVTAALLAVPYGPAAVGERVRGWVMWALLPVIVYHALRYTTFAAEFPSTYYAKVHDNTPSVWRWNGRAWMYLRHFAIDGVFAPWLPAVAVGLAGPRGWRAVLGGVLSLVYAAGFVWAYWGTVDGEWITLGLQALLALFGVLALSRGGMHAVMGALALFGLTFCYASAGDWMKGWRWMSLIALPIAWGMGGFVSAVRQGLGSSRVGLVLAAILGTSWTGHQVWRSFDYSSHSETSPFSIKKRVAHYGQLIDTLQLRRRPLVIDQDMGANLYWGGLQYDCRDARGLTDLPFALHLPRSEAPASILRDNVLELPAFIHLHAATRRAFRGRRWMASEYVEVPGYPGGRTTFHTEQWVRRAVLLGGPWEGPERPASFEGIDLLGWQVRSPEVSPGSGVFVELAVRLTDAATEDLELWLAAVGPDGELLSWSLPLGYGLFPPNAWRDGDVFVGKYPLPVRQGVSLGKYRMVLVAADRNGVRARRSAGGERPPVMSVEEAPLGVGFTLVDGDRMRKEAKKNLDEAYAKARGRSCMTAEVRWEDALAHRIRSRDWRAIHESAMRAALAKCWGDRGGRRAERLRSGAPEVRDGKSAEAQLLQAAEEIQRARTWDPTEPAVDRGGRRVAALLEAKARTLEARGEWDSAFRFYDLTVRTDPARVFVQRKVEKLRAQRLGLEDRLGPLP